MKIHLRIINTIFLKQHYNNTSNCVQTAITLRFKNDKTIKCNNIVNNES